ncbi:MAG: septal ring lytic transglycosylase RlpA family protein [Dongiaceae bacterium]
MQRSSMRFRAIAMLSLVALSVAACADRKPIATKAPSTIGQGGYKVGQPYQIGGIWYYPAVDYGYAETGIASWYGPGFDGKATANGEIYDMNQLTAAHRTLPLPSMVRVTNLENGRQLALRVNDRGPFAHSRIIDVSRRASQLLGFEKMGTARVRVEIMADESRELALQAGGQSQVAAAPPAPGTPSSATIVAAPTADVAMEALPPPPGATAAPASATTSKKVAVAAAPELVGGGPVPDGKVTVVAVRNTTMYIQAGAFISQANARRLQKKLAPFAHSQVIPAIVGSQKYYRVRLGPIASLAEADQVLARVVAAGHPEAKLIVD